MFLVVYQLRAKGRPLTAVEALRRPHWGVLSFQQGPRDVYGRGVMLARLLDAADRSRELVPCIEHARVDRLQDYVLLRGIEHFRRSAKSRVDRWDQTWLCCISEQQAEFLLKRAQRRNAETRPNIRWPGGAPSPLTKVVMQEREAIHTREFLADMEQMDADFMSNSNCPTRVRNAG